MRIVKQPLSVERNHPVKVVYKNDKDLQYIQDIMGFYYRIAQYLGLYGYDKEIIHSFLQSIDRNISRISNGNLLKKSMSEKLFYWRNIFEKNVSKKNEHSYAEKCLDEYVSMFFNLR